MAQANQWDGLDVAEIEELVGSYSLQPSISFLDLAFVPGESQSEREDRFRSSILAFSNMIDMVDRYTSDPAVIPNLEQGFLSDAEIAIANMEREIMKLSATIINHN